MNLSDDLMPYPQPMALRWFRVQVVSAEEKTSKKTGKVRVEFRLRVASTQHFLWLVLGRTEKAQPRWDELAEATKDRRKSFEKIKRPEDYLGKLFWVQVEPYQLSGGDWQWVVRRMVHLRDKLG